MSLETGAALVARSIPGLLPFLRTEEAAKQFLVLPFLSDVSAMTGATQPTLSRNSGQVQGLALGLITPSVPPCPSW